MTGGTALQVFPQLQELADTGLDYKAGSTLATGLLVVLDF